MPDHPGNRAAQTAERRERLVAAAIELAREGGYDAVQMRDVAGRADVALGTLYRHYPSKDHLLVAALARQAEQLQRLFTRRRPTGDTAAERVADVLARASHSLERNPDVAAAMITALGSAERGTADARDVVAVQLRSIIASAVNGDAIDDLDDRVKVLGYVWWAVLNLWVGRPDAPSMSAELARAAHLLFD